ncbi:helix-turn-helix domain-containing protein, partial [Klebsiella pneumoniae]
VCGKKIGPDPRNFNQRVSLGRNDLLIRTFLSFRTWKQRARICASLDLLANGVPIKQVAYQLGFSCPAAFTAAFRCILGATPRDYVP